MTYDLICERRAPDAKIINPSDVFPLIKRYSNKKQEHFLVLTIDAASHVIRVHLASIGLLNRTLIHPREVFVRAIKDNAASIILAHNPPSGNVEPSREDREATQRLVKAGTLLGIEVLDHLIIGRSRFYSFRESGDLPFTISHS